MGEKKEPLITINLNWCKGCGICYHLCPKGVLGKDELGKVQIIKQDSCSKCRLCEDHCPDYCIKIGG
jgi:2-oxoglutarate ferredoxin oxidoreductase subunit delta